MVSYLYEHGPLGLHDHLQQRLDQSLGCSWDQVEKVDDGRTDLHLLEKKSQRAEEIREWVTFSLGRMMMMILT